MSTLLCFSRGNLKNLNHKNLSAKTLLEGFPAQGYLKPHQCLQLACIVSFDQWQQGSYTPITVAWTGILQKYLDQAQLAKRRMHVSTKDKKKKNKLVLSIWTVLFSQKNSTNVRLSSKETKASSVHCYITGYSLISYAFPMPL